MATNQFFYVPEWKTVATVSTPSTGFSKLYRKNGGNHWYTLNDQGLEKQIAISVLPKNGINAVNTPSNVYDAELSLSLGLGLTFSADAIGSSVSVYNVTPNMLYTQTASVDGYVLSSTASGTSFEWIPFSQAGISGTTDKIAKFNSSTSISDSIMSDDGTMVIIGTTPSNVLSVSFANSSDQLIGGKLFLKDDSNLFIESNSGVLVQTDTNFRIQDDNSYQYLNLMTDGSVPATYTFSVLSNTLNLSDYQGYRTLTSDTLDLVNFGTTSATMSFNIYATGSVLRIKDGSEGVNKVFVSDSTGLGTWTSLTSNYVSFIGVSNSISKFTGSGLTTSFLYEGTGGSASSRYLGFGASFSSTDLPLRPVHIKTNDSGNFTKLAIHNYNTTNGNKDIISFKSDTTGASASTFVEFAAINGVYEDHSDSARKGRLEFYTRNAAISSQSNLTLSLLSDGTVYIPGTQSGFSALQFGSMTSSSPTVTTTVALSVDSQGRVILANLSSGGYLSSPYDKGLTANSVTQNGGTASDFPISVNPVIGSYVTVFVNGQEFQVGNGTTSSNCYFGTHSTIPKGFSASNAIQAGDYLYWNPSLSGFNLESGFRISLHYLM